MVSKTLDMAEMQLCKPGLAVLHEIFMVLDLSVHLKEKLYILPLAFQHVLPIFNTLAMLMLIGKVG
jgi:hypothetical protein